VTRADWIDWTLQSIIVVWFCGFVFGDYWALAGAAVSGLELWRLRREAARKEP
jgi:hypothetical protein